MARMALSHCSGAVAAAYMRVTSCENSSIVSTAGPPFADCYERSWLPALCRGDRDLTQLLRDSGAVEPDVLAADQPVAELEDVQNPEADPSIVARQPQHRTDDRPRHNLVQDHRVIRREAMQDFLALGAKVRRQVFVERARPVLAVMWAPRVADHVVLDVVGVYGDSALDTARALCPQMPGDDVIHLGTVHPPPFPDG